MRFNINLASQPYEAARQFRQRMSAVVAALALIAALFVGYIVYQRIQSRDVNRQLAEVQQEIDSLDREEAQARAILNKPENRNVADQSGFLNQLFARKALSWTRIFAEMERIMPPDLHVVSMKPEYTKANDLLLHVVVTTGSRTRAVELVRSMEKSSHFRQAEITAESVTANAGEQAAGAGNIQFEIAAVYLPNVQDADAATGGDEEQNKEDGKQHKSAVSSSATPPNSRPPGASAKSARAPQGNH